MDDLDKLGHETKFLLPAQAAPVAALLLAGVARPERPHPEGTIETIYLDDTGLGSYEEKRASDYRKAKLRLRWYGGGEEVFLESKQRFGSRRSKRRIVVPLAAAQLSRHGLAALDGVDLARLAAPLAAERRSALTATIHLRYRRQRFVAADGTRLALDREIDTLGASTRIAAPAGRPIRLPWAVLEVKGTTRSLPPTLGAFVDLGARRSSFSKYAACLESLAGREVDAA